jgi:hypothetical protein
MLTKFKKGDRCRIRTSAFGEKIAEGFEVENERVISVAQDLGMYLVKFTARNKVAPWTTHEGLFRGHDLKPAGRKAK